MARPRRSDLPSPQVREFRDLLNEALDQLDEEGRKVGNAKCGVYAFYDYDGEPIYVGQTNERLRQRIKRHLTNQRTDAVAMRVLDVFEVAELQMWPLWEFESAPKSEQAKSTLNALEHSVYMQALKQSRFGAILNEKLPPASPTIELPRSYRASLKGEVGLEERTHPDVRIARRAETISRLAAVAYERGEISDGLRRVLVVQAVRLTYLSAVRYAEATGAPTPDPAAIDVAALVGELVVPTQDELTEEKLELLQDAAEE